MISVPSKPDMRPAFSMIMAIFVIVIMASVGAFILNLSGKMIQETTAQYRKEQAILYAKSYTEYAILVATARACARKITANIDGDANQVKAGQGYRVIVNIQYLGTNSTCASNRIGSTNLTNADTAIVIDTYVHYRDPESPEAINKEGSWINFPGMSYHHRTTQRL